MPDILAQLGLPGLELGLMGKLLLAAALGGLVGLEREWSGKPAGFRTNLLICVGAALLTDLSVWVARGADPGMTADPARIAAQIVSGIGFLGAGTIIQSRGSVVGLTTAATLWVVAAVGMVVGAGAFLEATGATLLVVLALLALGKLEPYLSRQVEITVRITMERQGEVQASVEALMQEGLQCHVVEMERKQDRLTVTYRVSGPRRDWEPLVHRLMGLDGVHKVVRS